MKMFIVSTKEPFRTEATKEAEKLQLIADRGLDNNKK